MNGDLESYYYEAIYDIAPHYQKENGKTFSNFFIQSLTGAFRDIYKKDRIADPEFNKIRDSKTDNTKDNDTEEEDGFIEEGQVCLDLAYRDLTVEREGDWLVHTWQTKTGTSR